MRDKVKIVCLHDNYNCRFFRSFNFSREVLVDLESCFVTLVMLISVESIDAQGHLSIKGDWQFGERELR